MRKWTNSIALGVLLSIASIATGTASVAAGNEGSEYSGAVEGRITAMDQRDERTVITVNGVEYAIPAGVQVLMPDHELAEPTELNLGYRVIVAPEPNQRYQPVPTMEVQVLSK